MKSEKEWQVLKDRTCEVCGHGQISYRLCYVDHGNGYVIPLYYTECNSCGIDYCDSIQIDLNAKQMRKTHAKWY